MQEEQLYAGGRPFAPKTNSDNVLVKDNYKLTGVTETTMQDIINAIADRVVNRLIQKSELSDWAKQESKPVYTASEVGADASGSAQQALKDARTYADNTYTQATGYTDDAIARLINGAPTTLDTLKEIADAMTENESVVDALADAIGTKASEVEAQAHYDNTTVHITASERNAWNNKVDRVTGKNLSTNDYTTSEKNKLAGIADKANNYSLPLASASARGGAKTGYTANGKNYPVQLDDEKMYVNVPWEDNDTTYSAGSQMELSGTVFRISDFCKKIDDWNAATTNGWYMASNAANKPAGGWCYGIVIAHNNNFVRQIAWMFSNGNSVTDGNNDKFERIKNNGVWGSWVNTSIRKDVPVNAKFTDTTYGPATQSANGLMAAADKKKLDEISSRLQWKKKDLFKSFTATETEMVVTIDELAAAVECIVYIGVPSGGSTITACNISCNDVQCGFRHYVPAYGHAFDGRVYRKNNNTIRATLGYVKNWASSDIQIINVIYR